MLMRVKMDDSRLKRRYKNFLSDGREIEDIIKSQVSKDIKEYIPKDTGRLEDSLKPSSEGMAWSTPYARYVWYGKTPTGKDMVFNRNKNPKAGPRWTERYKADSAEELKAIILRRGVKQ